MCLLIYFEVVSHAVQAGSRFLCGWGWHWTCVLLPPPPTRWGRSISPGQERNVRTVPLMAPLQMGHFLREGAQSLQTTRWPQGMNTMDTSLSIHTLHVLSSCSFRNCSSMGRAMKRGRFFILNTGSLCGAQVTSDFGTPTSNFQVLVTWHGMPCEARKKEFLMESNLLFL